MVALDESYRDPTNLQSKLQKHQAFEAELSANKGGVDTICKVKMIFSAVRLSFISSVYLVVHVCARVCVCICVCGGKGEGGVSKRAHNQLGPSTHMCYSR